ncbi:sulfatase-like hydrolase/transferase [Arthrobacter psychrochitiniphilus]|uniref:sulfatase-like hydrolase/transferase n=1 Tax=Arthrobacter psychrochitiniphilus TaxID=291045 RepID=UPI003F7BEDD1
MTPRARDLHWYGLEGGGSPYTGATMYRNGEREETTTYLTDAITEDAHAFLAREGARRQESAAARPGGVEPFFLAVNYTAPHKPWKGQHPKEFEDLYADCAFESCPQEEPHPWQPTVNGVAIGGEPDVRGALVGYFAAVSAMDAAIGRLMAHLQELGLREDTLVIFSSDNGFNCGHHGVWGKGNGTFPQNMYDSSVKVPAIFNWPGHFYYPRDSSDVDIRGLRTASRKFIARYNLATGLTTELFNLVTDPFELHNITEPAAVRQAARDLAQALAAAGQDWAGSGALAKLGASQ